MGYRWHPVIRLVPEYGDPQTIDLTLEFTDASGPVETRAEHRPEVRRRTDVNRRSRPQVFGFRPAANLRFDILAMEDHASLMDILGCLQQEGAKVYLSLDGGITEREVVLRRYSGPRAIAGKQYVGGTYELQLEGVELLDVPPAMALDPIEGRREFIVNGRLEVWASSTDLDGWIETIVGGTVNQDSTEQRRGNFCCRLDRTAATGKLAIGQRKFLLQPGFWYEAIAWFKADTPDDSGAWLRIRNEQEAQEITNRGEWVAIAAPADELTTFAVGTTYAEAKIRFRVNPDFDPTNTYIVEALHNGANGESIYVDDIAFAGPVLRPEGGTW